MNRAILSAITIIIVSFVVIFLSFNQIPIYIAPDEIAFTRLALMLEKSPLTLYTPMETGHSTLYFYLLLLSFKLFGVSLFALRLPSAIFGVVNGLLFFVLLRGIFNGNSIKINFPFVKTTYFLELSLILSFIFIFLRWNFNFARFSFEATFLLFLELVSLICIFQYVKTKKIWHLSLSAIFAGLSFYSYTPGRIFFVVPIFAIVLSVIQTKKIKIEAIQRRVLIEASFLFFILWIAMAGPLVLQISQAGGDSRVNEEFVLSDNNLSLFNKGVYLAENVKKTALMFGVSGDMNGRHNYPGKPALNPILFVFAFGGMALSIRRRNENDKIFLLYLLVSLIPTIFTHPSGNPNMLRTFTAIVPVVYFVGVFIYRLCHVEPRFNRGNFISVSRFLIDKISKPASRQGGQVRDDIKFRYIPLLLTFLIIISSLYELRTYFIFQKQVTQYSFEVKKSFEWVKERNFELIGKWYQP